MRRYFVYILTNKSYTLYIGVTNNIFRRLNEHVSKSNNSFTKKYNINKLIYLEETKYVYDALNREKQIKSWSRQAKMKLIKELNPEFKDLGIEYGLLTDKQ